MSKIENEETNSREQWGGRTGFILAAVGSAVGLGNIWRFPGVAYDNGGGAFLLPYLVALLTAGIPLLLMEYSLGHRYRGSAPLALKRINKFAETLGWWQVGICFFVALYYAVIIAWSVRYVIFSINLAWKDNPSEFFFNEYLQVGNSEISFQFIPGVLIPLILVWAIVIYVLVLGVKKGLEKLNYIAMPLLVAIFVLIVVRSLFLEGATEGLNAFFTPNWGTLANPMVWIAAYGHIFFSLSVAFGVMVTYASYLKRKTDLTGSAIVVGFANSSFEILAGIGVFATLGFLAFQQNTSLDSLENINGVGLAFVAFPTLLASMPGGSIFGILFFLCLTFAGFTSIVSMVQGITAAVQDKLGWSAKRSSIVFGSVLGTISILLFSTTSGLLILDVMDHYVNDIAIVLSAIILMVILGMVYKKTPELRNHLNAVSSIRVGKWWVIMISYVAPAILTFILISALKTTISEGYGEHPTWFLGIFGWGTLLVMFIGAIVLYKGDYRGQSKNFVPENIKILEKDVNNSRKKLKEKLEQQKNKL